MDDTNEIQSLVPQSKLPTTADGANVSQEFQLDSFSKVKISSSINAAIEVGKDFSIRAEARNMETLNNLRLEVRGSKLVANLKLGFFASLFSARTSVTLYITMPELTDAKSTAGAYTIVSGAFGPNFEGSASSGATMLIEGLTTEQAELDASSGGSMQVSGSCSSLRVDASSGGSLNASKLAGETVKAEASSGGSLKVFATRSVDAEASSGGSVAVHGGPPRVEVDESSGGSVRFIN